MKVFRNHHKLKALNEEPTCFKNFNNSSCINLFLTNSSKSLEKCLTLETGMSDFHKLIVTILKVKSDKLKPSIADKINKKCQEIKQNRTGQETLISVFAKFLASSAKVFFWKGNWVLGSASTHF